MDFDEIMDIVRAFLKAIANVLNMLGLNKLFQKEEKEEETTAA